MPNVSADGKTLAYVSNRGGDPDVWVRSLDTGADRQLTSTKADEYRAVISPDARQIAFMRPDRSQDILTMPSGGGAETVVCTKCGNVHGWSQDGEKLVYASGNPIRSATVDLRTNDAVGRAVRAQRSIEVDAKILRPV